MSDYLSWRRRRDEAERQGPEVPKFVETPEAGAAPVAGSGGTIPAAWVQGLTLVGGLTIGAATAISGGGTINLGGYTLTVPATGTAALLEGAQTFTGEKLFRVSSGKHIEIGQAGGTFYVDTANPNHLKKDGNLVLSADPNGTHSGTVMTFNVDGSEAMRMTGSRAVLVGKTSGLTGAGDLDVAGNVRVSGNIGFYNTTPQPKPTVTGSRGGNAALASLLTALATLGLITNNSTA